MNNLTYIILPISFFIFIAYLFTIEEKHEVKDKNTTEEISLICVDKNEYLVYEKGDNLAVSFTFKKCEVEK